MIGGEALTHLMDGNRDQKQTKGFQVTGEISSELHNFAIGLIFPGSLILLIFCLLVVLYQVGKMTSLYCKHVYSGQVDCVKQTKWLGIFSVREELLTDVRQARVVEVEDSEGKFAYLELETIQGSVYFLKFNPSEVRTGAFQVNSLLLNPSPDIVAIDGPYQIVYWINGIDDFILLSGPLAILVYWLFIRKFLRFSINFRKYTRIIHQIENGNLHPDENGDARLPDSYRPLSTSGVITIDVHNGHPFVIFYTSRGFPGGFSGFMYRPDDSLPGRNELGDQRLNYQRFWRGWFHFWPSIQLEDINQGRAGFSQTLDKTQPKQRETTKEIPWD